MMTRKIFTVLFDGYLLIGGYILVTGGTFLLTPELLNLFRSKPGYHRLILSSFSLGFIFLFALAQFFGPLENHSKIIAFIRRLKIKPVYWLWFIFFVTGAVFSYSSFIRHHVFGSSFDFAIFAQSIRSVLNGKFLYSSIKGGICLLGDHAGTIILLFAPLYFLWDDPAVLLIFQALVGAGAIIPIYLISKLVLEDEKLGLVFSICYALYLPVRNAVRFDFHPEIVGLPLCLWAYYFVLTKRFYWASFSLFLTLLSKETACAPVAMFALYCWWFLKEPAFGIFWFSAAIFFFFLDIQVIVPYFSGRDYAYIGSNYVAWQKKGLSAFLSYFFQPSSFTYLKKIFLPLGFFSFLSPPALILTFPTLFQNLGARNELARSIFFQYTVFLTPYVFISAIQGFRQFLEWAEKYWNTANARLIGIYWLVGWSLLLSGVSELHIIQEYRRRDNPHFEYIRQFFKTIPQQGSVRTHEFFSAHLAKRSELHIYENEHPLEGGSEKAQNADYVLIDRHFLGSPYKLHVEVLKENGYVVIHERDGLYLLKRKRPLASLIYEISNQ